MPRTCRRSCVWGLACLGTTARRRPTRRDGKMCFPGYRMDVRACRADPVQLRISVEGVLLLVRLVAAGVVLLCSSKRSRGETGGALIVGSEWKKEAMVLASCVNSRREKRQRRWLVRLSDLRKEGIAGACLAGKEAGRGEERRGGLLLEKKRTLSWIGSAKGVKRVKNFGIC
ncbi:hypothetical protein PAHAL_3G514300 [Panicum hallii]|uniref:Uncharacterized protein n=1 Tax=Panicum hallii TaxID=206008 RepID=A0A2T8KM71_9POAL|nr:hypothetical protein PAHAL_3G514300 [Panicum hallii]